MAKADARPYVKEQLIETRVVAKDSYGFTVEADELQGREC